MAAKKVSSHSKKFEKKESLAMEKKEKPGFEKMEKKMGTEKKFKKKGK